ncbi:hypothetical protein [Pseudolabrys sp. FHR47]|uniref:hypothetical protein n=1 Tax=Pseudolabrys sp. FHR47 TaxID=2562284 RepID=UPI0010BE4CF2|nr:hypothetical protein [Pseudolabrys sp. FHR47]
MKTLFRQPLLRLLVINLAIGIGAAVAMIGGLMALNPHHLRDLILNDQSGGAAFGLLLFGLVITFGSVAMGTAIMALGRPKDSEPPRGKSIPATVPVRAR